MSLSKIAKLAGVSTATVSRVINKRPGISSNTSKRVMDIVKEVGYVPLPRDNKPGPNVAAKSIENGSCGMVLLGMESTIIYGPYARAVHKVESALSGYGLNMLLGCVSSSEKTPAFLHNGKADCVIFLGTLPSLEWFYKVVKDIPCLWVMSGSGPIGDHISPDNKKVGVVAAKYLLASGCRNLAGFVYDLAGGKGWPWDRKAGFESYLRDKDCSFHICDNSGIKEELSVSELTHLYIKEIKERKVNPDGIFVTSDSEVGIVCRELQNIGLIPGEDVKVISVNNDDSLLMSLSPRPATIDLCPEVIGQMGVEQILWRIQHPELEARVKCLVEPALIMPDGEKIAFQKVDAHLKTDEY